MTFTEDAFADRHTFFSHLEQCVSIGTLVGHALFPAVRRTSIPWPPVLGVALSVECAFARDRDVPLFEGVDERRVVEYLDAFPTREHDRQKVFWVPAELDRGAFRNFEIDVALQVDRAGEICARRNDDPAAARFRTLLDRFTKSDGAVGY